MCRSESVIGIFLFLENFFVIFIPVFIFLSIRLIVTSCFVGGLVLFGISFVSESIFPAIDLFDLVIVIVLIITIIPMDRR